MEVIRYKAEHLKQIVAQPAQEYVRAYITDQYCKDLEFGDSFTVMAAGTPVACGGIFKLWENRATVWAFLDRSARHHMVGITKEAKRYLDVAPYARIEADTDCDFKEGHRWLRMLGFTMEAERMRAFRPDGGDSALYARVR